MRDDGSCTGRQDSLCGHVDICKLNSDDHGTTLIILESTELHILSEFYAI